MLSANMICGQHGKCSPLAAPSVVTNDTSLYLSLKPIAILHFQDFQTKIWDEKSKCRSAPHPPNQSIGQTKRQQHALDNSKNQRNIWSDRHPVLISKSFSFNQLLSEAISTFKWLSKIHYQTTNPVFDNHPKGGIAHVEIFITTRHGLLVRTSKLSNGNVGHDSSGSHLLNDTNHPTFRLDKIEPSDMLKPLIDLQFINRQLHRSPINAAHWMNAHIHGCEISNCRTVTPSMTQLEATLLIAHDQLAE